MELLDEDYTEQTDLVAHALNGIGSVFELQSPTTKNDFCRMFIREGLLDPLSSALLNVMGSQGSATSELKQKIIQILLVFSQVTQSDIHVRNAMGTRKIVRRAYWYCNVLFNLRLDRSTSGMRATGTCLSGADAKGCQALVHECNIVGCAPKCECHRNSRPNTRRASVGTTQRGMYYLLAVTLISRS